MSITPDVVVVEHDRAMLEMFGEMLQFAGYNPVLYQQASLKPEDVAALEPNAILLDWSVYNEQEAFQFVEQVTSYPPTSTIPIIICTTAPEYHMQQYESWLRSRNVDVLYKPFEITDFIPMVTRYVSRAPAS